MRVESSETLVDVRAGYPSVFTITVFNTATVITGFTFRVLGADPGWVTIDYEQLNLFPDDAGTVIITLALPEDFPAGQRRLGIVVENVADPSEYRVIDIDVNVEEVKQAKLELAPSIISGGTSGTFSLVVTNTGNGVARFSPTGEEKEGEASIDFTPDVIDVAPGDQETVAVRVRHRRPLLGAPSTRIFTFGIDGVEPAPQTVGSFNQRPWIGRGIISLTGLLITILVFLFVITKTFDRVLDEAEVNEALLEEAIASDDAVSSVGGAVGANTVGGAGGENGAAGNGDGSGAGGSGDGTGSDGSGGAGAGSAAQADPGAISGRVTIDEIGPAASDAAIGAGISSQDEDVTVQLYPADDPSRPIATTSTRQGGTFSFATARPGDYKLRAVSAGFLETWYPSASSFADAEPFTIAVGAPASGLGITIRVQPGTIIGVVLADDPSEVDVALNRGSGNAAVATVREVVTDASGSFTIENVPLFRSDGRLEPYELVVTKDGFATERRLVTVSEGEIIDDIRVRLRDGDGRLAGSVTLGNRAPTQSELIQVMAAADGKEFFTVTYNGGQFTFRDLPTPALYSITATRPGWSEETVTATLASAEQSELTQPINLRAETRSIAGSILDAGGAPINGAELSASDGQNTFRTRSDRNGLFVLGDLQDATSYTVTAIKDTYLPTTTRLTCERVADCQDEEIRLRPATTPVFGVVCLGRQRPGSDPPAFDYSPLGGVTVTVKSASFQASTVSADVVLDPPPEPAAVVLQNSRCANGNNALRGYYRIEGVPAGVYTVTFSQTDRVPFTKVIRTPTTTPVHQDIFNTSNVIITVVDETSGNPVNGARVELWEESDFRDSPEGDQPTNGAIVTDDTGVALFAQVRPASYVVIVTYRSDLSADEQRVSRSFTVRLGQTIRDTIRVQE